LTASLGCGNPLAVADLQPGNVVLDLGSGGGLDVILSARRVEPDGMVYGLDASRDMIWLAQGNAEQAGTGNVEFLHGHIEDIPLPDNLSMSSSPTASSTCQPTSQASSPKRSGCYAPAEGSA
jgi:SAM-dependent methyltransferase